MKNINSLKEPASLQDEIMPTVILHLLVKYIMSKLKLYVVIKVLLFFYISL